MYFKTLQCCNEEKCLAELFLEAALSEKMKKQHLKERILLMCQRCCFCKKGFHQKLVHWRNNELKRLCFQQGLCLTQDLS